jgi:hypothetical protein
MFNADPNRTTSELLNDIKASAANSFNNKSTAFIWPPFAALLVRLSQEASVTADKNLLIQRRMIVITLIVLAISVAQLVLAFFQFAASVPNNPQSTTPIPKAEHAETNQKTVVPEKKPSPNVPALK